MWSFVVICGDRACAAAIQDFDEQRSAASAGTLSYVVIRRDRPRAAAIQDFDDQRSAASAKRP
jgi:hypothetical protein